MELVCSPCAFEGFLLQLKDIYGGLSGESNLAVGVDVSSTGCLKALTLNVTK